MTGEACARNTGAGPGTVPSRAFAFASPGGRDQASVGRHRAVPGTATSGGGLLRGAAPGHQEPAGAHAHTGPDGGHPV
jgi:hypothetical protein